MSKRKNKKAYNLDFYISNHSDLDKLCEIIKYKFGGKIPLILYNEFFNRILNPSLKRTYIQVFSKIVNKDAKVSIENLEKDTNRSNKHMDRKKNNNDLIENVRAKDFVFKKSLYGPRIVYNDHETYFLGDANWFVPEILNSIDRTFKIKLRSTGVFCFVPIEDKEILRNLLSAEYNKTYSADLNDCIDTIKIEIKRRINQAVSKYRKFKIEVPIDRLVFDNIRQVYTYSINVNDILSLDDNIIIEISSQDLYEVISEVQLNRFHKELNDILGKRYRRNLDKNDFVPNLKSDIVEFKIPVIVLERLYYGKYIKLEAVYSEKNGIFIGNNGYISQGYSTESAPVIFNDNIKKSLKFIIRQVNSPYIETFYTSFQKMFNEGDLCIKALLNTYGQKYKICNHVENNRYCSGYSELMTFDPDNKNDWMWLSTQLKKGVFEKAYSFFDLDETYSTKAEFINKSSIKIYVAVERVESRPHCGLPLIFYFKLHLYSLDTTKSIYIFEVLPSMLNEAIFFLWSYFSSNNYNKRQDFHLIRRYQKLFGILDFERSIPLKFKHGIGYYEYL